LILDRSDNLVLKRRNDMIKVALQAPELDSRFYEVSDTHTKTFF